MRRRSRATALLDFGGQVIWCLTMAALGAFGVGVVAFVLLALVR